MSETTPPSVTGDMLTQPQARSGLLAQYLHVLSHPSVTTFTEVKDQGKWRSIWLQLVVLGVITAILSALSLLITPLNLGGNTSATGGAFLVSTAIILFIATPCSFFIASGVLYLFARLFKGDGTYLEQTYTLTLFGVPMVILGSLLSLIPGAGSWLMYVPHIYSVVLFVLSLRAVHHVGTGRAIAIILVPAAIFFVLALVLSTVILLALPRHS